MWREWLRAWQSGCGRGKSGVCVVNVAACAARVAVSVAEVGCAERDRLVQAKVVVGAA